MAFNIGDPVYMKDQPKEVGKIEKIDPKDKRYHYLVGFNSSFDKFHKAWVSEEDIALKHTS